MVPFYPTPALERASIRRAIARSGCFLRHVSAERASVVIGSDNVSSLDEGQGPPGMVAKIACADGWQAGRLLLALAIEDSRTDGAKDLAAQLRAESGPDDEKFARAIHAFVKANVHFVREHGELFQSGQVTLARGAGDCDDHFRLAYAIARAGGIDAALGMLSHANAPPPEDGPTHAGSILCPNGVCVWAETTVDAEYGEEPNAAARRLGLTSDRSDISSKVTVLKENDLAPLPDDYRDRNDPVQVRLDCEALQRLGYYPAASALTDDPTGAVLRLAVIDFQNRAGIIADGLLGPTTRQYILKALVASGVEGFDYPGMGDLTGGNVVASSASADISDDDIRAVIAMTAAFRAQGATCAAEDFFLCWQSESGNTNVQTGHGGRPGVAFPGDTHAGFNQMGPQERAAAGWTGTLQEWLSLSMAAQMPYIQHFYSAIAGGPRLLTGASAVYLANAAPSFMSHAGDLSFVIYPAGSDMAKGNPGLAGAKQYVTIGDLVAALRSVQGSKRYTELRDRARALGATPAAAPLPGSAAGGNIALLLIGTGLAAAAAYYKGWIG